MSKVYVAEVAVENAVYHFDKAYDYLIPDALSGAAKSGCRVMVPFGNSKKKRQGMILKTAYLEKDEAELKKMKMLSSVLDEEPLLSGELLSLVSFLKDRTFCTLYDAVKAVLPTGINNKIVGSYAAVPESDLPEDISFSDDEEALYAFLSSKSGFTREENIEKKSGVENTAEVIESLLKKGALIRNYDAVRRVGDLTVKMIRLTDSFLSGEAKIPTLTKKQADVVELLTEIGSASVREVCYFTGYTPSVPLSLA
ncbi:MAG: primosomal protein N', partial [Clostridiales bacterium]|nr:primosomal protein N' [Clostridiales bacterium]